MCVFNHAFYVLSWTSSGILKTNYIIVTSRVLFFVRVCVSTCACTMQYICSIRVTVNLSCISCVHNDLHYANNDVDVNLNLLVCGNQGHFPVSTFDQC